MHKNTNMTDDCFTMFDDELGLLLSNYIEEDWYMFESEKWRNKYHKLRNDAVKLINEYNAEVEAEAFATSEQSDGVLTNYYYENKRYKIIHNTSQME